MTGRMVIKLYGQLECNIPCDGSIQRHPGGKVALAPGRGSALSGGRGEDLVGKVRASLYPRNGELFCVPEMPSTEEEVLCRQSRRKLSLRTVRQVARGAHLHPTPGRTSAPWRTARMTQQVRCSYYEQSHRFVFTLNRLSKVYRALPS
ncbi:hypothetical protein GY45DRAFT_561869 [Cubamyces sp. BRFM 1775]|nr:hypothetical protein GY45DRAFT_561869 [Cubamyces sp. BRFM 1775]